MMVVMLIMSIILAAMAPVMTTRSKADSSSPWRYSPENLSDAYFGAGESQIAMIGQPNKLETDDAARLILTTSSSLPVHLSFKRDNTTLGRLQFVDTNLVLGNGSLDHLNGGSNNISIGPNNLTQVTSGGSNIAIGDSALTSTTSGNNNIGIGTTLASNVSGNYNVAVGDDSLTKANSSWNVAIGTNAYQLGTGGSNTIVGGDAMSQGSGSNNVALGTNSMWYGSGDGNVAIGANSNYKNKSLTTFSNSTAVGFSSYASGNNSVSIGSSSISGGENSIAIGNLSNASDSNSVSIGKGSSSSGYWSTATGYESGASGDYSSAYGEQSNASGASSIALGNGATSSGDSSVALGNESRSEGETSVSIGVDSRASGTDTIAIGNSVIADGESAIAIGSNEGTHTTQALANKALAIGDGAYATGSYSIALGTRATSKGQNNIAIGVDACQYATGSNKICIGAQSGPDSGTFATDSVERIFIGGKPKMKNNPNYSGGTAPLEIHNDQSRGTSVVVNGTLLVRGHIAFSSPLIGDPRLSIISNKKAGSDDTFNVGGWLNASDPYTNNGNPGYLSNSWISDIRMKYVGKEFTYGLEKIRQLKVFNYTFKKDKTKTPHVGVIAQDLQKVFPDAVKKSKDGFLTIRFEDMFYAMINAIKELDLKYEAQEKRMSELEARVERLEAKLK